MDDTELERRLVEWGLAYGRVALALDKPSAKHALARGAEFAPGSRVNVLLDSVVRRGGELRRRTMARAAGIAGMDMAPGWAADPVPCSETRVMVQGARADSRFTPAVERTQAAVMALYRYDSRLGLVVRMAYCERGTRADKADRLGLALYDYRSRLQRGTEWLRHRLGP